MKEGQEGDDLDNESIYAASWWTQFVQLAIRSIKCALREPLLTKVRIIQTLVVAAFVGMIYAQVVFLVPLESVQYFLWNIHNKLPNDTPNNSSHIFIYVLEVRIVVSCEKFLRITIRYVKQYYIPIYFYSFF